MKLRKCDQCGKTAPVHMEKMPIGWLRVRNNTERLIYLTLPHTEEPRPLEGDFCGLKCLSATISQHTTAIEEYLTGNEKVLAEAGEETAIHYQALQIKAQLEQQIGLL